MYKNGFTLIELLVVISIIGILSSVVIANIQKAREKSKITQAKSQLYQLRATAQQAIFSQNDNLGNLLIQTTGSGCSDCVCRTGLSIQNVTTGNACWDQQLAAWTAIFNFAGKPVSSVASAIRDPWGSPYFIDENFMEGGPNDNRADQFCSAGPNGVDQVGVGDDICVDLN